MPKPDEYVLYLPGLGDHTGLLFTLQSFAVRLWRLRYGVHGEVFLFNWKDDVPLDSRIKQLLARAKQLRDEGKRISLVGVSAGASAALHGFAARPQLFHTVICVAGEINGADHISNSIYQANPLFAQSMQHMGETLKKLSAQKRQSILSLYGSHDRWVPERHSYIPGAKNHVFKAYGHVVSIALALTVHAGQIIRFIRKAH